MAPRTEIITEHFTRTVIVDGVLRHPPSGIKLIIVGGGPGGLATAVECWRKGHDVEVLEKAPEPSSIGDIVALGPSAWATLHHYPTMLQEYVESVVDTEAVACHMDGEPVAPPAEFECNRPGVAKHAAYPIRVSPIMGRRDLATLYLNQARRLGIPITWNVDIVDYQEDTAAGCGVATARDGKEYRADIVVAADGIGSKSHRLILGRPVRAVETGYTIYRTAVPTRELPDTAPIKKVAENLQRAQTRLYAGHGHHVVSVLSPRIVSLAVTLPTGNYNDSGESWVSEITANELIGRFPNFENLHSLITDTIKSMPDGTIVAWKLCMRDPQPTWTSKHGHVVQVGDSAHSFVPTSANGAAMALEDAISLAECLALGGKDDKLLAVKAHELLRKERVTLVQQMGLLNRGVWHQDSDEGVKELAKTKQGKWLWTHNAERYTRDNFFKTLDHVETGAAFQNTNLPPGYKPKSWTLEEIIRNEQAGIVEDPTENGDWSLV